MNNEVAAQLTRARTGLVLDQPFYGMLALRLQLVEEPGIPTAAVDGKHIFYNPEFVAKQSPEETKTLLGHEVMHCVFEHIGRRGDRESRRWNQAGDFVINDILVDSGFTPIKNWLHNKAYAGMTTDHVYEMLPPNDGDGTGGAGDPLDDCQDGAPDDAVLNNVDWKIATVQAAAAAKAMGKLPGKLARFVDELTSPKVDWRAILQRFITETSKNDYSWTRPNKRFLAQGFVLPTLHSETMGEIVVAIDTSGSIDQATLAQPAQRSRLSCNPHARARRPLYIATLKSITWTSSARTMTFSSSSTAVAVQLSHPRSDTWPRTTSCRCALCT